MADMDRRLFFNHAFFEIKKEGDEFCSVVVCGVLPGVADC